jgi:hypothetical protein
VLASRYQLGPNGILQPTDYWGPPYDAANSEALQKSLEASIPIGNQGRQHGCNALTILQVTSSGSALSEEDCTARTGRIGNGGLDSKLNLSTGTGLAPKCQPTTYNFGAFVQAG